MERERQRENVCYIRTAKVVFCMPITLHRVQIAVVKFNKRRNDVVMQENYVVI